MKELKEFLLKYVKNITINKNKIPFMVHQQLVYMDKHLKFTCKNILEHIFFLMFVCVIFTTLINKHIIYASYEIFSFSNKSLTINKKRKKIINNIVHIHVKSKHFFFLLSGYTNNNET